MAALTTAQEYDIVRQAIQALSPSAAGVQASIASFTIGEMTVTYSANQMEWLQQRERELAKRLTVRNSHKRVTPDFGGPSARDYLNL
jgi:hypothetical protein